MESATGSARGSASAHHAAKSAGIGAPLHGSGRPVTFPAWRPSRYKHRFVPSTSWPSVGNGAVATLGWMLFARRLGNALVVSLAVLLLVGLAVATIILMVALVNLGEY